jgi:hypothetical protein
VGFGGTKTCEEVKCYFFYEESTIVTKRFFCKYMVPHLPRINGMSLEEI